MKPGAIITPKTNDPAKAKFVVRDKTKNGWVRCHSVNDLLLEERPWGNHIFKFRAREMEVVG